MIVSDLERLIDSIQKEKNIPRDVVIEILESARMRVTSASTPGLSRTRMRR